VTGLRLRWTVVIVGFDPTVGHEQGGERRALVVTREPVHRSGLAAVCPITAARSEVRYPGDVRIPAGQAGQTKDGIILCHQLRTISLERVKLSGGSGLVGRVEDPVIRYQVRQALLVHLGLDIPLEEDD
jgi:mRNA-degrading endonuclease toxin of MazEF toxin-antitoxin module